MHVLFGSFQPMWPIEFAYDSIGADWRDTPKLEKGMNVL